MQWTRRGRSADLEDRRDESAGYSGRGGGIVRVGSIGIGGVAILFVLSLLTGHNFLALLDTGAEPGTSVAPTSTTPGATSAAEEDMVQFVSFVLDDSQATWTRLLGDRYRHAKLVLFRDAAESACGFAQSATGPFYCPADEKVYIDLGFYDELKRRFGAPGDFAQAYVLAHEIGHHVQKLLGTEQAVRRAQQARPGSANTLSVRMELQADCYAGIWGNSTARRNILEQGDAEDALRAAASIGDDRIQRSAGARVSPESFTHGSSEQRVTWFRRGLESGSIEACDTFRSGQ